MRDAPPGRQKHTLERDLAARNGIRCCSVGFDAFDEGERCQYAVDKKLRLRNCEKVVVVREGAFVACVGQTFEELVLNAQGWQHKRAHGTVVSHRFAIGAEDRVQRRRWIDRCATIREQRAEALYAIGVYAVECHVRLFGDQVTSDRGPKLGQGRVTREILERLVEIERRGALQLVRELFEPRFEPTLLIGIFFDEALKAAAIIPERTENPCNETWFGGLDESSQSLSEKLLRSVE